MSRIAGEIADSAAAAGVLYCCICLSTLHSHGSLRARGKMLNLTQADTFIAAVHFTRESRSGQRLQQFRPTPFVEFRPRAQRPPAREDCRHEKHPAENKVPAFTAGRFGGSDGRDASGGEL